MKTGGQRGVRPPATGDGHEKTLNSVPKQLQRILLQLQKYNLLVHYKKGQQLYIADMLRAYLLETHCSAVACEITAINQTATLALSAERLQQFKYTSADDPVLSKLRKII